MYFYCICGKEGDLRVLLFRHLLDLLGSFKVFSEHVSSPAQVHGFLNFSVYTCVLLNALISERNSPPRTVSPAFPPRPSTRLSFASVIHLPYSVSRNAFCTAAFLP